MKRGTIRRLLAGMTAAALIFSGTGTQATLFADDSIAEEWVLGESAGEETEEDLSEDSAEEYEEEPVYSEPEEVYSEEEPAASEEEEPVYSEPEYVEEPVYSEPEPVFSEPEPVYSEPEAPVEEPEEVPEESTVAEGEDPGTTDSPQSDTESSPTDSNGESGASSADSGDSSGTSSVEEPQRVTGSLSLSMSYVNAGDKSVYLASGPYLYVYLEPVEEDEPSTEADSEAAEAPGQATTPEHYLIKLRYNSSDRISTASVTDLLTGTYDVTFYTAVSGKESKCDSAAQTISSVPDPAIFSEITSSGVYAGDTMQLQNPPTQIAIEEGKNSVSLKSGIVRESLTLGAYKLLSGVSSTTATFSFALYASDKSSTAISSGAKALSTGSTSGTIKLASGQGVDFSDIVFTEPGDYYFIIRETTSNKVSYFTYDTSQVKVHVKVSAVGGKLAITEFESGDDRKLTLTAGSSGGKDAITIKGLNPDAAKATAANYSYELYGPINSASPSPETDGTFSGKPAATASLTASSGKYYYTFNNIKLSHSGTKSYAIVEKENGTVNREHTIIVPVTSESGINSSWALNLYGAVYTNEYKVTSQTKKISVKTTVSGSPSKDQTHVILLKNKAGKTVATREITGEGTDGYTIRFSKAGTYTYTVLEQAGSAKGYTYDSSSHTIQFVVKDDKQGNLSFKITQDGKTVTNPAVTFANAYAATVKIALVNSNNRGLTGGKLRVYNADGKKVDGWVPDGNWHTVKNMTADGKYTIKEVSAPTDYVGAKDSTFTLKNGEIKGQENNYIKILNTTASGSFSFNKISATSGAGLGGATFTIYRIAAAKGSSAYTAAANNLSSGKIVWSEMSTYQSQGSGSGGTVTFSSLAPNTYYVIRETSPTSGFQKSANSVIIKTTYANNTFTSEVLMSGGDTITRNGSTGAYEWREYPTRVVIVMRSSSGAYLKGAKLALTDTTTGNVVEAWQSGSTGHEVSATMVVGRTYRLEQTNKLKGYTNSNPITFTVAARDATNASPVQYVTFTDQKNAAATTTVPGRSSGGGSGGSGRSGSGTSTTNPSDSSTSSTDSDTDSNETDSDDTDSSTTDQTVQTNSADTGDTSPIIPLAAAMALAVVVILILVRRKKK